MLLHFYDNGENEVFFSVCSSAIDNHHNLKESTFLFRDKKCLGFINEFLFRCFCNIDLYVMSTRREDGKILFFVVVVYKILVHLSYIGVTVQ